MHFHCTLLLHSSKKRDCFSCHILGERNLIESAAHVAGQHLLPSYGWAGESLKHTRHCSAGCLQFTLRPFPVPTSSVPVVPATHIPSAPRAGFAVALSSQDVFPSEASCESPPGRSWSRWGLSGVAQTQTQCPESPPSPASTALEWQTKPPAWSPPQSPLRNQLQGAALGPGGLI